MKYLKIILIAYFMVALAACSQKITSDKVPAEVKASFAKQFPSVIATWEKENGKYEANFKENNQEKSAAFNLDGSMAESEVEIKDTELPASVLTYVTEHYKGKKIKSAAKITMADGTISYEANVKDKDVLFDKNGNFIKEVKQ